MKLFNYWVAVAFALFACAGVEIDSPATATYFGLVAIIWALKSHGEYVRSGRE